VNVEDVLDLQRVDSAEFIRRFNSASGAVRAIDQSGGENRWTVAAEQVCLFLDFVINEDALWTGLHRAVDVLGDDEKEILDLVGTVLDDFVDVEFGLLVRQGIAEQEAARITDQLRIGLLSFEHPSHEEIKQLLVSHENIHTTICSEADWPKFGEPERHARHKTNVIAALTGGGGLVATVVNGATAPVMPLFVLSIAGGIASAVGSLLGWRRHR